jgi:hypothetical protein
MCGAKINPPPLRTPYQPSLTSPSSLYAFVYVCPSFSLSSFYVGGPLKGVSVTLERLTLPSKNTEFEEYRDKSLKQNGDGAFTGTLHTTQRERE